MNFLEFAVWGAYLISMGGFLASKGMGANIGWFYSIQGVVSIFMPAIVGILADRFIQAQRMLAICHFIAAICMIGVGVIGSQAEFSFWEIFPIYTLSVAAYMPTLALSNSVSYNALEKYNLDTVKAFPPSVYSAPSVSSSLCWQSISWVGSTVPNSFMFLQVGDLF